MENVTIQTQGDAAILISWEQTITPEMNHRISAFVQLMREQRIEGVVDLIPAFCSVLVNYDPRVIRYQQLVKKVESLLKMELSQAKRIKRIYQIPVCYGGEYGPDLPFVAENANLSVDEVIALHTEPDYLIYMLGFLPGFSYLGGLDERIHTPRLANPRMAIPAGSVGIGGSQTGIYPLTSPGGWQLIGQTPVKTYDPIRKEPILFEAGNYIRFVPISPEEFVAIAKMVANGTYEYQVIEEEA
ncbi:5-oxoprolinase subunit PxpB [Aerococcaceae bacterium zg-ZUI334]|uniref:5-oxoprolinase subunit PxpB n=1 Tax=Aerococcaceae TaxID=186827 RepID=UPI0013B8A678|nr:MULTISPECIES: 5-oxoprolinase subunit PxpB [unclassified Facklamia]MBR7926891.1 5-oxoprolinase subunit PxpB [Aerococcaceae bacterium zg-ZUI334]MBS4460962.1 5-oxoprolinase subunit PxpB [Aerococcaceae bacterium zg-B36]QQD64999.1 5-oxoprolinase subunit PxpB [Aerococcaceae bacterium zg-252]NEW64742.1 5-oxoprolinase subunit PxpB [Facklamia sp. 252]NEW68067.1 5-oxoprolinase subunit PxpB [Facklamia sp. 253]